VGVSSVGVEGIGFAIPVETVSSVVAGLMAS
jgi:S1-C subfamily serine protease